MQERRGSLLVCNAGSSSLKVEVFAPDGCTPQLRIAVSSIGRERAELEVSDATRPIGRVADHRAAAELVLAALASGEHGARVTAETIGASVHRVVHGGDELGAPVAVDDALLAKLEALGELAPLHNPPALAIMRLVRERLPETPSIAVFDTAFFHDLPEHVRAYALPSKWTERHRIRRYGFHGIAHEYLARRHRELARAGRAERVLSLQLGQGCSITALYAGRPVETSMGYTPLEGLVMGTRPGDVDPGVLLALARGGESWAAIENGLQQESGLRGLSGATDDMRELLAREAQGDRAAALAVAAFCHRAIKYLGAYSAVLGGVDAVLFGGGIGENSPRIRSRICAALGWLGLALDEQANAACIGTERSIAAHGSAIDVYVLPVHEEAVMVRAAARLLQSRPLS